MAARKKKTAKGASSKVSKKLSWADEAQHLLKKIFAKSKSPSGAVLVLTQSGDVIFQVGKTSKIDRTSLGALLSAQRGLKDELNSQLKTKSDWVQFGENREGFWVDYFKDWIIVAIRVPYSSQWLSFHRHLKKYKAGDKSSTSTSEALAGLSEAAVDMALKR